MDRKTATVIQNLQDAGFKNEAEALIRSANQKIAQTMPRYTPQSDVSLVYHNSDRAVSGVVTAIGSRKLTVLTAAGEQHFTWTGKIFETDDDNGLFSIPVAILPEYGD